ncbi:MAG: RHS repeat-associated core domain-containing protein, partial [Candidatus Acidiferrales bacterium]
CGNSTPFTKLFPPLPVNPCQHPRSSLFAAPAPPSEHNHARYDKAGRITQLTKVIGTNTYTTGYQYNVGDEVTQINYPSGRVVQMSYNLVGQLCEIAPQTSTCGSSTSPYAKAYAYNPSGQLTAFNYGNGVAATYTYSATRSQLSSIKYVNGTQTLFNLNYFYGLDTTNCPGGTPGNDGQIQCITDGVDSGRTANYTYDALGRVSTALTNGSAGFAQWGLAWSYDQYGNRLCQTLTAGGGYQGCLSFANPGGAQTNRPDGWCFDASGNLLAKSGTCPPTAPNFVYDGENRMVADPTAGATYMYDGNGTRVQKCLPNCTTPSSSTVFVFSGSQDIAEYDNGAAPSSSSREFIYSDSIPGAGLLATITGGSTPTTTYFHDDHLSWRVSTDGTSGSPTYGQVNGQQGSYPFGESWYSSNGNEFAFTTYQRDAESGLDYAMARYYDSTAARFCSADPLGGQLDDPQTWNRYTYVRNDPIDLTDPSGQGFFSWLMDALLILGDIFSGGVTTPESIELGISLQGIGDLATVAAIARTGFSENPQGQKQPAAQTPMPSPIPPVLVPPGYTVCPQVNVEATFVGLKQAHGNAALTNPPRPPRNGEIAIRPRDFGVDYPGTQAGNDAGKAILRDADIRAYPDWSRATDMQNGKPSRAPNFGGPAGPMIPNRSVDIISPPDVRNDPDRPTSIDVYRSKRPADLKVPTIFVMKQSDKVHCPK